MSNNINAPFGLQPINENGTPWSGQGKMVAFAASDANNIFRGDPLVPTGLSDAFGVPQVTIASAGATNTVLGAFISPCNGPAGSGVTLTRDNPTYRPASVLNYGIVCDDPNQLYAIQEDSLPLSAGFITAANGGFTNANLIAGAGSTVTGYSGWLLDSSTDDGNANPTYQMRILGLLRGPDNAIGNYAKWVCRINLPALWAISGY